MKLRLTFFALLCVSSLAQARGGETGTLDEAEPTVFSAQESGRMARSPFYLPYDHFRRMKARLGRESMTPIPGFDPHKAWRWNSRYFSEDNQFEILPLEPEPQASR